MKLVCPKCAQDDKGFSREWLIGEQIDNAGNVVEVAEVIPDTRLLMCLNPECGEQFKQSEAETTTGSPA